jgi:hypothetical protein
LADLWRSAAQRAALEYFSIARMADEMLKVFEQVLAQEPRNI